jgi:hypothetical protein
LEQGADRLLSMKTMRIPTMTRLALAALMLAVLAFAVPRPAGAQTSGGADVYFSIADEVSAEDEAYVREGIALAEDYLRETLNAEIENDLTINVREMADPDDPYILAYASGNAMVVYAGSPAWETLSPALRIQTVIHEYVHIYQGDTLGDGADASPMWFIEGMAEYLAYDAIVDLGIVDQAAVDDFNTFAVRYSGYHVGPLEEIEAIWDFQSAEGPVYPLAYLAVGRLVGELPSKSLEAYLQAVDDGANWRKTFQKAFGLKLDDFYAQFDAWVARDLQAADQIPAAFREVFPEEQAAPVEIHTATERLLPGEQALVLAATEPGSLCHFTLRDDEGQKLATLQTFADRTGIVFWLVTVPADTKVGRSGVLADCGDKRDRASIVVLGARDGTATSVNPG